MNEHKKIKKLIKFLKENSIGLSSKEIANTYCEFLSYNNNNSTNDFLTNKFGKEWTYLEHELKSTITKYISTNI